MCSKFRNVLKTKLDKGNWEYFHDENKQYTDDSKVSKRKIKINFFPTQMSLPRAEKKNTEFNSYCRNICKHKQ